MMKVSSTVDEKNTEVMVMFRMRLIKNNTPYRFSCIFSERSHVLLIKVEKHSAVIGKAVLF